ncbi:MAG: peptidyl-prolyl cis-trans isomerase [Balneolaceae bacterium]|nr:peptidyl-prolyl cis-trans isomerase [Balneolaceae bacterium]
MLLFFCGIGLSIVGCQQQETATQSNNHLAKVGTETLTIEEAVAQIPDHMIKNDSLSSIYTFREDWVQRQLILQEARRLNIDQNEEIQHRLERMQQEVLIQGLKDYVLAEYEQNLQITDEEARNYYQAHKNQLVLNEQYVRYRHMSTSTHSAAQSARQDLLRGIEWPEVARMYANNPEASIQESEKFWPISMALVEYNIMNTMLQRIGISEISPIQRVNGEYHFVQLMETRPEGGHPDLDWLIGQIKEWLRLEKRRRHFNSYVKNLYLNAQSNNEIETTNVLGTNSNSEPTELDTVGLQQTND